METRRVSQRMDEPANSAGRIRPDGDTSEYPQFFCVCTCRLAGLGDAGKVRAKSISFDGFVRKGGGCERKRLIDETERRIK